MLGIPPSDDWYSYCVDEALHMLESGHRNRDMAWDEKFRKPLGEDDDLYEKAMRDPRSGRPPSSEDLGLLAAAQRVN